MVKQVVSFFLVSLILSPNFVKASEFVYGDYFEAFNHETGTIYIYKSGINNNKASVSLKALEIKKSLTVPNDGTGEPYVALKYSYKFDCKTRKYAGGLTNVLEIESGWININTQQVKKQENTWNQLPNRNTFIDLLPAFCKK